MGSEGRVGVFRVGVRVGVGARVSVSVKVKVGLWAIVGEQATPRHHVSDAVLVLVLIVVLDRRLANHLELAVHVHQLPVERRAAWFGCRCRLGFRAGLAFGLGPGSGLGLGLRKG